MRKLVGVRFPAAAQRLDQRDRRGLPLGGGLGQPARLAAKAWAWAADVGEGHLAGMTRFWTMVSAASAVEAHRRSSAAAPGSGSRPTGFQHRSGPPAPSGDNGRRPGRCVALASSTRAWLAQRRGRLVPATVAPLGELLLANSGPARQRRAAGPRRRSGSTRRSGCRSGRWRFRRGARRRRYPGAAAAALTARPAGSPGWSPPRGRPGMEVAGLADVGRRWRRCRNWPAAGRDRRCRPGRWPVGSGPEEVGLGR